MKPVTLIIADDHPIVRQGMQQVLLRQPEVRILAEAANGEQALALIRSLQPDVAILDLDMPTISGLEVAKAVRAERLPTVLIMMTAYKDVSLLNAAIDNGVSGFIVKENAILEILTCIERVVAGERYVSPVMTEAMLNQRSSETAFHAAAGIPSLTVTERKILQLVARSKTSREIADDLFISVRTVENHRNNICKKLDLSGANALLRFALEHRNSL